MGLLPSVRPWQSDDPRHHPLLREPLRATILTIGSRTCSTPTGRIDTDRKVALRVMDLVDAVLRAPFAGIGKPEPLKALGAWSRRLTQEHRLVYVVHDDRIVFVQARYHY